LGSDVPRAEEYRTAYATKKPGSPLNDKACPSFGMIREGLSLISRYFAVRAAGMCMATIGESLGREA